MSACILITVLYRTLKINLNFLYEKWVDFFRCFYLIIWNRVLPFSWYVDGYCKIVWKRDSWNCFSWCLRRTNAGLCLCLYFHMCMRPHTISYKRITIWFTRLWPYEMSSLTFRQIVSCFAEVMPSFKKIWHRQQEYLYLRKLTVISTKLD